MMQIGLATTVIPRLLVDRHIVHVGSDSLLTKLLEQRTALLRGHMVNIQMERTASFSAEILWDQLWC